MSKPMDQAEVQTLFRKFAAPLAGYAATSPARKELAEMLARNLWTALIAGPEMEEETWKVFKNDRQAGRWFAPGDPAVVLRPDEARRE